MIPGSLIRCGATTLPRRTGKTVRVAVFTQGENAEKATAAGADPWVWMSSPSRSRKVK